MCGGGAVTVLLAVVVTVGTTDAAPRVLQPVQLERVWLNSALAYDSRPVASSPPPLFRERDCEPSCATCEPGQSSSSCVPRRAASSDHLQSEQYRNTPYTANRFLHPLTERLGVVGPLLVQWTLALEQEAAAAEIRISIVELDTGHTVVNETVASSVRSWHWVDARELLQPNMRYQLNIGASTVLFRAGPQGHAGGCLTVSLPHLAVSCKTSHSLPSASFDSLCLCRRA